MSVWPAWEVREAGGVTSWFHVRLAFVDGARVELLAVVCEGRVSVEDVSAQPPLSLVDLTVLADWIEGPLFERCDEGGGLEAAGVEDAEDAEDADGVYGAEGADGVCGAEGADGVYGAEGADGAEGVREPAVAGDADEALVARRARPAWPRGIEGRWLVAQEYRAAQEKGADPVLAVMCATGHSRRRSLRLIAQARDAGYLTPRHVRR
ncbi:hypothetical protein G9272_06585 [Streptomyces asoensis]|uniref:Uncharacterized protein n=1 Tax=Streptomyces asoensis TaxID=249586 RepID=A0A6M4WHE4_9ACTN|nr:DUF6214 family protein [Streptomyces asoensis]QJS99989.1 hypothetical protein G9272_06585 [Streptomyces asoensis]